MHANKIDRAASLALMGLNVALAQSVLTHMRALLPRAEQLHEALEEDLERKAHGLDFVANLHHELAVAEEIEAREKSRTWLEACKVTFGKASIEPADLAKDMIGRYLDAERAHEFGYSEVHNPGGRTDAELVERCIEARSFMMAALSDLSDEAIEAVIKTSKGLDHDGSLYAVSTAQEVRKWQATYGSLTIAECKALDQRRYA